jgi:Xaa-Pro aminopeptidase
MSTDHLTHHTTIHELSERLARVAQQADAAGVDAVVVSTGADMQYLVGRSQGSHERLTAVVIPSTGEPFMVVPQLELPGWANSDAQTLGLEMLDWADGDDPYSVLAAHLGAPTLVMVDDAMTARHVEGLGRALGCPISAAGELLTGMRATKSPDELTALEAVAAAVDRVHGQMAEWLRPGRTETQVGADIAAALEFEGHQRADFVIVGSGPNGASPHLEQTERIIAPGDAVVVDIGGPAPSGYFSDSTRTYCVGSPADSLFEHVYDIVLTAQDAAFAAATAGNTAASVDAAARAVITDAGFGDHFITRTGHGIGLEVHEHPYIVRGNHQPLSPGMAFSIEPGIYLPGRFGVRIEDIVVIDADGSPRRLNSSPRHWQLS